jgi:hypothetical protein
MLLLVCYYLNFVFLSMLFVIISMLFLLFVVCLLADRWQGPGPIRSLGSAAQLRRRALVLLMVSLKFKVVNVFWFAVICCSYSGCFAANRRAAM